MPLTTILIAERDPIVALDLAVEIAAQGYVVIGTIDTLEELYQLEPKADGLLFNAYLKDGTTYQVARNCMKPFAFVTAHEADELPKDLQNAPMLLKPFLRADLTSIMERLKSTHAEK